MQRILVAGATGHLGRYVVPELKRQGYHVRALTREPARLNGQAADVDEVHQADLTAPESLRDACEEIDVVLSCAGASMNLNDVRDRAAFDRIDFRGNRNLLEEAQRAGVSKFVYVALFQGEQLARTAYAGAHERFVQELRESGMPHTVVRPTAFFSFLSTMVEMAKSGRGVVLGTGEVRTNPIHEADLAELCVAAITAEEREIAVGGPEVYSRKQLVELAFEALGRSPRLLHVPIWAFQGMAALTRPFNPRLSALLDFGAAVSAIDLIAPAYGTRELKRYYAEVGARLE